jgi:hypothetical protein
MQEALDPEQYILGRQERVITSHMCSPVHKQAKPVPPLGKALSMVLHWMQLAL